MKASLAGTTVKFEGILDEATSTAEMKSILDKAQAAGGKSPIAVDLSGVTYANSRGVMIWLRFVADSKTAFKYVNTPVWMVKQFNIIGEYFLNGSFVETFQAPYFAPETEDSRAFLLKIGTDVPVQKSYAGFSLPNRVESGIEYEIDFEPDRYLSFIAENYESFKARVK